MNSLFSSYPSSQCQYDYWLPRHSLNKFCHLSVITLKIKTTRSNIWYRPIKCYVGTEKKINVVWENIHSSPRGFLVEIPDPHLPQISLEISVWVILSFTILASETPSLFEFRKVLLWVGTQSRKTFWNPVSQRVSTFKFFQFPPGQ